MSLSLETSLRRYILNNLPHTKSNADLVSEMSTRKLLIAFCSWSNRVISSIPRKVQISETLQKKLLTSQFSEAVTEIVSDIGIGANLRPYQSRDIDIGISQSNARSSRRRDLDMMLNDWQIHHLHLGTRSKRSDFVGRTRELLFVFFALDTAYLIDIGIHGDWAKSELLKILMDELPEADAVIQLPAAAAAAANGWTEDERKSLRNSGLSSFDIVDDRVVMPVGGGVLTSGDSLMVVDYASILWESIHIFDKSWREKTGQVLDLYSELQIPNHLDLMFEFDVDQNGVPGVRETKTKHFLPLLRYK